MSETSTTRIGEILTPLPAGQIWEMRDSKGYVIFWKNVGTYSKLEASLVYSHGQREGPLIGKHVKLNMCSALLTLKPNSSHVGQPSQPLLGQVPRCDCVCVCVTEEGRLLREGKRRVR